MLWWLDSGVKRNGTFACVCLRRCLNHGSRVVFDYGDTTDCADGEELRRTGVCVNGEAESLKRSPHPAPSEARCPSPETGTSSPGSQERGRKGRTALDFCIAARSQFRPSAGGVFLLI